MALGVLLLFSFQNCGPNSSPIEDTKEITYDLASTSETSCQFNGTEVLNGDQVVAYASPTSTATNPCQPQEQTCENGILKTANGAPAFRYPYCRPVGSAPCEYNVTGKPTVFISHNAPAKFYNTNEVDLDQNCETFATSRYCSNGSFFGDQAFSHTSCVKRQPLNCSVGNVPVLHRTSVKFFQSASVAYDEECTSEMRSCYNGNLTGSYTIPDGGCTKRTARNCTLDGETILHGPTNAKPFFKSSTVPFGQTCVPKNRSCTDGVIGSENSEYVFKGCVTQNASNCTFDGISVGHNLTAPAYKSNLTPATLRCDDPSNMVQRRCFNSVMDAAQSEFRFSSCRQDLPVSCTTADGKTIDGGTTVTLYKTTGMYPPTRCSDNNNSETVQCLVNGTFATGTTARLKDCAPAVVLNPPMSIIGISSAGHIAYNFICPNNKVATGFHGRAGADVDAIGLLCEDGFRSAETYGGGGTRFNMNCPTGKFLVGANVTESGKFRSIRAICAEKNGAGLFQTGHVGNEHGDRQYAQWCPAGWVVYSITGFHGDRVGRLQMLCTRVADAANVNCAGEWVNQNCSMGYYGQPNIDVFRVTQHASGNGSQCEAPDGAVRDRNDICQPESF